MEFISIEDKRKPEPRSTVVVELSSTGWGGKPIFAIADIGYEGKFEINEDGYEISLADDTGLHVDFESPVVAWAQL